MKKTLQKTIFTIGITAACILPGTVVMAHENVDIRTFDSAEVTLEEDTMQYRLFDPASNGYEAETYPLVVFLHGEDGVGTDNNAQLIANAGATLWAEETLASENPAYVLAPQCSTEDWTDDTTIALVKEAIDEVVDTYNIDEDRIYIQGMSMGGTGTWKMLLEYPDLFAAGMPICGEVPEEYYTTPEKFEALKNMPIWVFHSADDTVIPVSETENAVAALQAAGSNCIKYEEYSAGSISPAHNIWERVYEIGTPYNWLMIQSRTRTADNTLDPSMLFSKKVINDQITRVCDYELGQIYVLEGDTSAKAFIIDTGMGGFGQADLYAYLKEKVFKNPDISFDLLMTHNHVDHVLGIPSLMASGKLEQVYIHQADEAGLLEWMNNMSVDLTDRLSYIADGDTFDFDGDSIEAFELPGHTPGSVVFFYDNYIFTGDAIGSGDLWLVWDYVENYLPAIERFVEVLETRGNDYEILTGHAENKYPFTVTYVKNMLTCTIGILDGSLPQKLYTRRVGAYATYNTANIYYNADMVNAES